MKLEKFKEKDNKRIGIIVFTLVCILLVSSVILYRTFAIFEVKTSQNVIKGTVQDPGDIYFAFYVDNNIQKEMPQKNSGYILDEENSYCGVTGENDSTIEVSLTENWELRITGVTSSRTKCNLKFVKGAFILGKPVKAVTTGNGLYEIPHGNEVTGTTNDTGFKRTEWRFAGKSPNNYVTFNEENWRIIGLVNVMTSENEVEQRVKLIRDESLGNITWNTNNTNNWAQSSLENLLNMGDYYNKTEEYSKNGLSDIAKQMIEEVTWNIGGSSRVHSLAAEDFYHLERGMLSYDNQPYTWTGKIALFYPSDYAYAVARLDENSKCLSSYLQEWFSECYQNDWLYDSSNRQWTLTQHSGRSAGVFYISNPTGIIAATTVVYETDYIVKPTLYLNTNVKIYDGNGTEEAPFELRQEIYE